VRGRSVNKKKVLGLSIVLIIGLAGFIGTLGYYQALLVSKESQMLSLSSIIEQSNIQISDLADLVDEKDDGINNLSFEVINLTEDKDDLSSQILNLHNQKKDLESQISTLNSQIQIIQSDNSNTDPDIIALQNQIVELNQIIETRDLQIRTLLTKKEDLENPNATLTTQIEYLQIQVEYIQANYDFFMDSYKLLREEVNQRFDPTDPKLTITPNNNEISDLVQSITGGWSNTSDFNEFWTDVKNLYFWVGSNIEYRSDGLSPILPVTPYNNLIYTEDMWQFPEETFDLEKGDCEDQGILLCSMIRCYTNQEYATDCIWITDSESTHIGVQIPVSENKLVILDPARNYYSKDFLGNIVFNDITVEINNWFNDWKASTSSDVYVKKIFSDYRLETFSSMNEYLTWMQNYGFSGIVSQY